MRLSFDAENPWLYACRTGDNQNFAALRSRAICTCTGSLPISRKEEEEEPVWAAPKDRRTHDTIVAAVRMSHRPGWRRALGDPANFRDEPRRVLRQFRAVGVSRPDGFSGLRHRYQLS